MHLIRTIDGAYRQSQSLRWLRTVAYLLLATAGVLFIASPLFRSLSGTIAEVMAWFLVGGGVLSAIGSASTRWFGEFTGLPLLGTAFLVFGLVSLRDGWEATPYIAVGRFCLLSGVAVVMAARWRTVFAIYRIAVRFRGKR